jgi:hypothetical protein
MAADALLLNGSRGEAVEVRTPLFVNALRRSLAGLKIARMTFWCGWSAQMVLGIAKSTLLLLFSEAGDLERSDKACRRV